MRQHRLLAHGAEGAVFSEEGVDAGRVEDVGARQFADEGVVRNEVVEADGAGCLGEEAGFGGDRFVGVGGDGFIEVGGVGVAEGAGGFFGSQVGGLRGVGQVDVEGQFIEDVLRHGEPFDAEGFEVDLAARDAATEPFAASALDAVHYEGGGTDD